MYNEDIQERGAQLMLEAGLPQGRMLDLSDNAQFTGCMINAVVESKEDGPFWYGDLSYDDLSKLTDVATTLSRELIAQASPDALGRRSLEVIVATPR